ncbi:winged helix-turn-helix domain-containing protein [Phormidesmis sp. 146-35]
MEKKTIAQAAIEVLKAEKQPMTAVEITEAILKKELYSFNTKDPKAMVRGAIERRCEGINRRNSVTEKFFEKLSDGKYAIK